MNKMTLRTRQGLGAKFREELAGESKPPQIALATKIVRAIDLSCRACSAMAMGAGLGFPVGDSAPLRFHPQPPIISLKNPKRFQYSFGLTIVTFERLGCIGGAIGLTIVASERPRCVWTYYSNV